ncbi:LamG-like jellyroll fold domain-containing protein [Sungkyunkwania multivorans]|uniref:LamG-like jellyroll fold domain-containing protein n=1 Tax=Sungkyunkwania multivorans TaxID=1173618 RepID=A0ABW3D1I7_9FLAO
MEKRLLTRSLFLLVLSISFLTVTNAQTTVDPYRSSSASGFPDTDGDTITDELDLDDDNDGVLDTIEQSACLTSPVASQTEIIFLNETFGSGTTRSRIDDNLPAASTTYPYEDGVGGGGCNGDNLKDGYYTVYYSISNADGSCDIDDGAGPDVASWADSRWYSGGDHTGDVNGKMAIFNADLNPGVFYQQTISGVLPNVPITYSFWAINIDNRDSAFDSFELPRRLPNITVQFLTTDLSTTLFTLSTGDITRCGDNVGDPGYNQCDESVWQQFTANTVSLGTTDFVVRFINNGPGGLGNDLALDDIQISQVLCDTDGDGVADVYDLDADNDGISNLIEAGFPFLDLGKSTVDPSLWVDTNRNGVHDIIDAAATDPNYLPDTDGDGILDYKDLDSDNDSLFDIDEAGFGTADVNGDGVCDITGPDNDQDGIATIIDEVFGFANDNQPEVIDMDNDNTPDFLQLDSDNDGNLDITNSLYADLDNDGDGRIDNDTDTDKDGVNNRLDTFTAYFGSPRDLNRELSLYFDGVDDYVEDTPILGGLSQATLMAWVRLDPTFSDTGYVVGQNRFHIRINSSRRLNAMVNGSSLTAPASTALGLDEWIHVAAIYDSGNATEKLKLYINGVPVNTSNSSALSGGISNSANNFAIGRNPASTVSSTKYFFKGNLDEVRAFDIALTDAQLQEMVYQRIEEDAGVIRGKALEKNITGSSWGSLIRYYDMDEILDDQLKDRSFNASDATLYNIKRLQDETTPLPFVTDTNGPLLSTINVDGQNPNQLVTSDHAIIRIAHQVSQDVNVKVSGLIIDSGSTLTVSNNSLIQSNHYLKIDGKLDLQGESQLIQTIGSICAASSLGSIARGQEGTADEFTYNYFSSPVSTSGNAFQMSQLRTPEGLVRWISSASPPATQTSPITLSNWWVYKFDNQLADSEDGWAYVGNTGSVAAGLGFTLKGSGTGAVLDEQPYIFEGKPNNGEITHAISAGNETLVGNPYPSALDANKFIDDNVQGLDGDAITGTLYFWEHFGGGTHIQEGYQGNYGLLTKGGGVPAPNFITANGEVTANKTPGRYIPVGQGFFVASDSDGGTIRFKNSQRVFELEGTDLNDNSTFIRSIANDQEEEANPISRIRLGFENQLGFHRQLLLAITPVATDGVDFGYDGAMIENQLDDLYWLIDDRPYIIQAIGSADPATELSLGLHVSSSQEVTFNIDELENIDEDFELYLRDNYSGQIIDLLAGEITLSLDEGEYSDRFSLIFSGNSLSVDDPEDAIDGMIGFYDSRVDQFVIKNHTDKIVKNVAIYDLLGQVVQEDAFTEAMAEYRIPLSSASGAYIAVIRTENSSLTKKFIKN